MKLLKWCVLLGMFLLFLIPSSFAEIDITIPDKGTYNLGEKIAPEVSIKEDSDYNGFFTMRIICDDYELQYYASPLNLEAGVRTQVEVPQLTLFSSMEGTCRLKVGFDSSDGAKIDTASSGEFVVADAIKIATEENVEAKPGEELVIVADIKKQSGEALSKGEAEINFLDSVSKVNVSMGKLEYKYNLGYDAESGIFPLKITIKDKYSNYGEKSVNVRIMQIPTRIENRIEDDVLDPGDDFKAKILLYDHNAKIIENEEINAKVFGPDEKIILEENVKSSEGFGFGTDEDFAPGVYYLLSSYGSIKGQSTFTIAAVRKIAMRQEGNVVYVSNTGNTDYNDEATIILESNDKKYLINRKLELGPGESITIDLSKEVPSGTYDITLPEDAVEQKEGVNETSEEFGPANLVKGVVIQDNRNIAKKTASGISAITGAVVSTAGYVVSKPLLASTILIVIILGVVTYYGRGFIAEKIKGKKPEEETSELFEDFDFGKKE